MGIPDQLKEISKACFHPLQKLKKMTQKRKYMLYVGTIRGNMV